MVDSTYKEKVYAGILGKLIGVFRGRPVEGWTYKHIQEVFGTVQNYVHNEVGHMPLHVPDDDLSGTFAFLRVLDDCKDFSKLSPRDFGKTWLNYVIENKTIFWWGGFGRSTEQTAFQRLQEGYEAPESGSSKLNTKAVSEQIGAMIFIDGFALVCPNDAKKARWLARQAASVSHDGMAVEMACFLVTLEAYAFSIKDITLLLHTALQDSTWSSSLVHIVEDVMGCCNNETDWRLMRDWLDRNYGYDLYPGNCPVVSNFCLILVALILGKDDFSKALEIVVSSGWDTDCNAGNLCCLNGIRLGLDAITTSLRGPIADRFYCISSLGSDCVTDAVQQTDRIANIHAHLYGLIAPPKKPRFHFLYRGSVQGFVGNHNEPIVNGNTIGMGNGLFLKVKDMDVSVSTLVSYDPQDRYGGYELVGSPTLYEGQLIQYRVQQVVGEPTVRPYVVFYDDHDILSTVYGSAISVRGEMDLSWRVPHLSGLLIQWLGFEVRGNSGDAILLKTVDWRGSPKHFYLKSILRHEETGSPFMAYYGFTSSAKQFQVDKKYTFCVSHPQKDGVVAFGTDQWDDYVFTTTIIPSLYDAFGVAVRIHGHRKYYAGMFASDGSISLIMRDGDEVETLSKGDRKILLQVPVKISLSCKRNQLAFWVNDRIVLGARDDQYRSGGAGWIIDKGSILVDDLAIEGM